VRRFLRVNSDAPSRRYDRAYLLSSPKRNDVLELWEVERYGRDSYGDPDYVSIYGLRPQEWYAGGVRLLARAAVECTRDRLADLIGRDIAAVATGPQAKKTIAIDPFAGSANTLYWISRHVGARAAIGWELDEAVYATSKRNLAILDLDITLLHAPYQASLSEANTDHDDLLIVYVAPPWGDALRTSSGLDLRQSSPPVFEVIDQVRATFDRNKSSSPSSSTRPSSPIPSKMSRRGGTGQDR